MSVTRTDVIGAEDVSCSRRLCVVWEGGSLTRPLPERGTMTIGRSTECDVRVEHSSVSRLHARLELEPEIVRVRDLGSANGVRLGATAIPVNTSVDLWAGQSVQLGDATLLVQSLHVPSSPSRPAEPAPEAFEGLLDLVAPSTISVLLRGETGAGKEVAAARIHAKSDRRDRPLVKVNGAAFNEALLESELFGHERGAFTGATTAKRGLLESAHGGTFFLDEVGELSASTQAKLLRVLENREVLPVGGLTPRAIDVRFIAATNRDLALMASEGTFRLDLYHRLAGITVRIPALRERRPLIRVLAERFAEEAATRASQPRPVLGHDTLERLLAHSWPGNIRELRNVMDRAVLLARGGVVTPLHLVLDEPAPTISAPPPLSTKTLPPAPAPSAALRSVIKEYERQQLVEALERHGGNQTRAAAALGISRRTLVAKLDEFALPRPRKK